MKKIILFLCLLTGVEVNAQIVGGYLPINSTKSFTAGNSTFSNVIARGTMSATGATTLNGLTNLGNGITVGTFSVGSTATVTGALKASSTMSLGSANLTGGNTGTVAVLSDAVFAVNLGGSSTSPADATTYYFGNFQFAWTQSQGGGRIYMPYNATLVGWTANFFNNGTLATTENATLAIGVSNSYTNLSTVVQMTAIANTYSGTASTNVDANSYFEARLICPTWATNPTTVGVGITFWFVRRS